MRTKRPLLAFVGLISALILVFLFSMSFASPITTGCGPTGNDPCTTSVSTSVATTTIGTVLCSNICGAACGSISGSSSCASNAIVTNPGICHLCEVSSATPASSSPPPVVHTQIGIPVVSPAANVALYNTQNAPWFLTCPLDPSLAASPADSRLFYAYPYESSPMYKGIAGDACGAISSTTPITSAVDLPINVTWDNGNVATATIGSFNSTGSGGYMRINALALSPMLSLSAQGGRINTIASSSVSSSAYVYENVPASAVNVIWTWSATFPDFSGTIPNSQTINAAPALQENEGTYLCDYAYNYSTTASLAAVSGGSIPFNTVNVIGKGKDSKFSYLTFNTPIVPFITFNFFLTDPNGQVPLYSSYDVFSPWNYNTPQASIDQLPIDTPSGLLFKYIGDAPSGGGSTVLGVTTTIPGFSDGVLQSVPAEVFMSGVMLDSYMSEVNSIVAWLPVITTVTTTTTVETTSTTVGTIGGSSTTTIVGGPVVTTIKMGGGPYWPSPSMGAPDLTWSGHGWWILNSGGFSSSLVSVDGNGWLHLKQSGATDSEIITSDQEGYGTYTWVVQGIHDIDKNAVIGVNPYLSDLSASQQYHELDIEQSKWGNAGGTNFDFVVQPNSAHLSQYFTEPYTNSDVTYVIDWEPTLDSFYIKDTATGTVLRSWSASTTRDATGVFGIMTVWHYLAATSTPTEVIFKSFSYVPSGDSSSSTTTATTTTVVGGLTTTVAPTTTVAAVGPQSNWKTINDNMANFKIQNPNVLGPISIAASSNNHIYVLNFTAGKYMINVMSFVPRGYHNLTGYEPNAIGASNELEWDKMWNGYWSNVIDMQNNTIYTSNSIDLTPYLAQFIANAKKTCDSSISGCSTLLSATSAGFTPLNISVDQAGDVYITGDLKVTTAALATPGGDMPGIMELPGIGSGFIPSPAAIITTPGNWIAQQPKALPEIAVSPDGSWIYAANPTQGYVYQFGHALQNSSQIDLTYTPQVTKGASQALQGPQSASLSSLDILWWLGHGGLYGVNFDGSAGKENVLSGFNNQNPSADFDVQGYHHPVGLANVNGYLYILDDWQGKSLGSTSDCLIGSILGFGINFDCKVTGGTSFDILTLRVLDPAGYNVPISPSIFNDVLSQGSCTTKFDQSKMSKGTVSSPSTSTCFTDSGNQPIVSCGGSACIVSTKACSVMGSMYSTTPGAQYECVGASTATSTGTSSSTYYSILSTGQTTAAPTYPPYGWILSADIGVNNMDYGFCSGADAASCQYTPNALKAYSFRPIGPLVKPDANLPQFGFSASYSGQVTLLVKKSSQTVQSGVLSTTTYSSWPQSNTLIIANFSVENYTKYFDGSPDWKCYTDASGAVGLGCDVLPGTMPNWLSHMQPPVYTAMSPFRYIESIGSRSFMTLGGTGTGAAANGASTTSNSVTAGGSGTGKPLLTISNYEIGWGAQESITAAALTSTNIIKLTIGSTSFGEGKGAASASINANCPGYDNVLGCESPGKYTVTATEYNAVGADSFSASSTATLTIDAMPMIVLSSGITSTTMPITINAFPANRGDGVTVSVMPFVGLTAGTDGSGEAYACTPSTDSSAMCGPGSGYVAGSVSYTTSGIGAGAYTVTADEGGKRSTNLFYVFSSAAPATSPGTGVTLTGSIEGYAVVPHAYSYTISQSYGAGNGAGTLVSGNLAYAWNVPAGLTINSGCTASQSAVTANSALPTSTCTVTGQATNTPVVFSVGSTAAGASTQTGATKVTVDPPLPLPAPTSLNVMYNSPPPTGVLAPVVSLSPFTASIYYKAAPTMGGYSVTAWGDAILVASATGGTGAYTYSWNLGSGMKAKQYCTSSDYMCDVVPSAALTSVLDPTTYSVSVKATDSAGAVSNEAFSQITATGLDCTSNPAICSITSTPESVSIFAGQTAVFDALSATAPYTWSLNMLEGNPCSSTSTCWVKLASGATAGTVTLNSGNIGGVSLATIYATISPSSVTIFQSGKNTYVAHLSGNMAGAGKYTYHWTVPTGLTVSSGCGDTFQTCDVYSTGSPGGYRVGLQVVDGSGNVATNSVVVDVQPLNLLNMSKATIQQNQQITLTMPNPAGFGSGPYTYNWTVPLGLTVVGSSCGNSAVCTVNGIMNSTFSNYYEIPFSVTPTLGTMGVGRAGLTVIPPPLIMSPAAITTDPNNAFTITATSTGDPAPSAYSWSTPGMTAGADCGNGGNTCTVTGSGSDGTIYNVTATSKNATGGTLATGFTKVTMRSSASDPVGMTPYSIEFYAGDSVTITALAGPGSGSCPSAALGLPSNSSASTGTVYSYSVTNYAKDTIGAGVEGGQTFLNDVANNGYYIANLTNAHLILPPNIQYNVQNDRIFGNIWVNDTLCTPPPTTTVAASTTIVPPPVVTLSPGFATIAYSWGGSGFSWSEINEGSVILRATASGCTGSCTYVWATNGNIKIKKGCGGSDDECEVEPDIASLGNTKGPSPASGSVSVQAFSSGAASSVVSASISVDEIPCGGSNGFGGTWTPPPAGSHCYDTATPESASVQAGQLAIFLSQPSLVKGPPSSGFSVTGTLNRFGLWTVAGSSVEEQGGGCATTDSCAIMFATGTTAGASGTAGLEWSTDYNGVQYAGVDSTVTSTAASFMSVAISSAPAKIFLKENEQLTANLAGGAPPYAYVWTVDPGLTIISGCKTDNTDGTSSQCVVESATLGLYPVSVKVTDGGGAVVSASTNVNVEPIVYNQNCLLNNQYVLNATAPYTYTVDTYAQNGGGGYETFSTNLTLSKNNAGLVDTIEGSPAGTVPSGTPQNPSGGTTASGPNGTPTLNIPQQYLQWGGSETISAGASAGAGVILFIDGAEVSNSTGGSASASVSASNPSSCGGGNCEFAGTYEIEARDKVTGDKADALLYVMPPSLGFGYGYTQTPVEVPLFDLYKEMLSDSPMKLDLNASAFCLTNGTCGSWRGYHQLVYVMTDRFGNLVYAPVETDIAEKVVFKGFAVNSVTNPANANMTTLSMTGQAGVLSSTGSFTPLAFNDIYLYYDKDINYADIATVGGSKADCNALPLPNATLDNAQRMVDCAFNVQDSMNPNPSMCVQSNPVYTTQQDFRCPDSQQVTYAPQFNSKGTCNNATTGLLMPQYFECNVYNNPMGDSELSSSCPNTGVLQSCGAGSACGGFASINDCLTSGNAQSNFTDSQAYCNKLCPGSYSSFVSCISTSKAGQSGKPQYCVPTDSFSGNGICTSQLGLISNVTTDKNGYFNESNVTACGSGQVLIKADFYGYPAPEPIEVLQVPLQFTANEVNGNCAETTTAVGAGGTGGVGGAVGGLVGISTGCLADAIALGPQAELNYSYGPTEASQVLQIGLVELKFGGLGALEIVAGAGMALLLIFRHGLGRKEAPKGRKGNALIGKESKHD